MPNYGLVVNSKFRPFSYQEMLAPVLQATQAHQAIEDMYGNLQTQAEEWKKIAKQEPNSRAATLYNTYAQDLEAQAEALASQGLTPGTRRSVWDMTKRYNSEIRPIESAYKRKQLLAEEQRKAGDKFIYDFNASTASIDKFLNNDNLNYQSIDRIALLQRSQAAYKQFADRLADDGFRYDKKKLDKYHHTLVKEYGFSPEEAAIFIDAISTGEMTHNEAVNAIARNLYKSTNVDAWNNEEAKKQVWETIAEGITMGIGKTDKSLVTDEEAVARLKASLSEGKSPKTSIPHLQTAPRYNMLDKEDKNSLLSDATTVNSEAVLKAYDTFLEFEPYIKEYYNSTNEPSTDGMIEYLRKYLGDNTAKMFTRAVMTRSKGDDDEEKYSTKKFTKEDERALRDLADLMELGYTFNIDEEGYLTDNSMELKQALLDKYKSPVTKDVDVYVDFTKSDEQKQIRSYFDIHRPNDKKVKAVKVTKDGTVVDTKDTINTSESTLKGIRMIGTTPVAMWETKDGNTVYSKFETDDANLNMRANALEYYRKKYNESLNEDNLLALYHNSESEVDFDEWKETYKAYLQERIYKEAFNLQNAIAELARGNSTNDYDYFKP